MNRDTILKLSVMQSLIILTFLREDDKNNNVEREDYQYIQTKLRIVRGLKKKKRLEEAIEELTRAMEDFPQEPFLKVELADCIRIQGESKEAEALALAVLEEAPANLNAHKVLGDIYLEEGLYDKALDHFEAAARIRGTGYVTSRIIKTLIELKRFDEAKDLIREELIESPDNLIILRHKAQILAREDAHQKAADVYQRICDLDPGDEFSYKELLRLKSKNKEPTDVSREIKTILKVSKAADNPHLHSELALNLKKAGKYEEAIAEFQNALALSPNNTFILSHLGFCYSKLRMPSKVVETLSTPFIENPKDFYVKSSLMAAVKKGRYWKEFKKIVEKAIETHPREKTLWGLVKKIDRELEKKEG